MDNEKSSKKMQKNIKLSKNKKTIADPQSRWLKTEFKKYFMNNIRFKNFKNITIFNQKYITNKFENFISEKIPETSFQFFQILSSYRFLENFKNK